MNLYLCKKAFVAIFLMLAFLTGHAQMITIHIDEPGTLSNLIDINKQNQLKELRITGYLNGFDVICMRGMDNLEVLDMTNSTIVSGGIGTQTENNKICSGHFKGYNKLKVLKLPSSLLSIEFCAFDQAYLLESIEIGESLKEIHPLAFLNDHNGYQHASRTCENMKEFIVSEKNLYFSSVDGVLFNKEKTELIFYPNAKAKKYSIPNGIASIREKAFSRCNNLYELEIPATMAFIGNNAFENCLHLMNNSSLNF